jgi:elongation factor P
VYESSDIRKGLKIMLDGQPYTVIDFQFVKPGKGTAFTRTRVKNLLTGAVLDRTFRTGEKLEPADVEERQMQYLYREGDAFVFMDTDTYEQTHMDVEQVGEAAGFMPENLVVSVLIFQARPVGLTLPNFVELQVIKSDPGVRGDTASGTSKPATLSTGATIAVPLFINEGEVIRIDTRTGEYMERVR